MRAAAHLLLMIAMALCSTAARAERALFDAPALSDGELAQARGGFVLPGGGTVDIGVVVTTSVDGVRMLQTRLQANASGVMTAVSAARDVAVTVKGSGAAAASMLIADDQKNSAASASADGAATAGTASPASAGDAIAASFGMAPEDMAGVGIAKEALAVTATGAESPSTASVSTAAPGADDDGALLVATVQAPDLVIQHVVGRQIAALVANTGDNRVIDSQLTISLRLENMHPLAIGSLGFRVEALGLDAARWRGAGS